MKREAMTKRAAIGATVGFTGLAAFQLLLAAGAPFGEAAWSGATEGQLSRGLRVGSAISIVVYAVAAALILRRAGFWVRGVSRRLARVGSWVLVVLLALGMFANFLSQSPWERLLLGPITLVLAGLCLVVASSATENAAGPVTGGAGRRRAAPETPPTSLGPSR
jgi:hypothetical protein